MESRGPVECDLYLVAGTFLFIFGQEVEGFSSPCHVFPHVFSAVLLPAFREAGFCAIFLVEMLLGESLFASLAFHLFQITHLIEARPHSCSETKLLKFSIAFFVPSTIAIIVCSI